MTLLYGLFVGVVMGALIQRMRASSPGMIAANLRLENLSVIKFMATAIAVGALGLVLFGPLLPLHQVIKPTYVLGVLAGGLIFGVGFALAGYCPGTCVVGAAEGRKDALFTLLGGLVGALGFTVAYPFLEPRLIAPLNFGRLTLPELLHAPAAWVALGLAAVLLAVVAFVPTRLKRPS